MNYALIFAGGSGQRMRTAGIPKQFLKIEGTEIIIHTIQVFENCPSIDAICVVCIEGWIEHLNTLLVKHNITKVVKITEGGKTGQESIFNGLRAIKELSNNEFDTILIHDGVRPFIDTELIDSSIKSIQEKGSAIAVSGAIETIVTLEENQVKSIFERSICYHAKAPQGFLFKDLYDAHQKALKDGMTTFIDSASIMQHYGYSLHTVECSPDNIKITTPTDYYIAKAIFLEKENKTIFGV